MQNFELLSELDGALTQAEISAEKGRHIAFQVYDSMSDNKKDCQKLYYYDQCRLMSDIAFDYAVRVDEELKKVRKLYNELFEKCREESHE